MRIRFDIYIDEFEMVKEERITNKKTGEELSLSIINEGHDRCVIEIKRKRIDSKTAKKNAK